MPSGTVKRFDPKHGYGFIESDIGEVFVHQNDILMKGYRRLIQGQEVEFETEETERGLKAVQVKVTKDVAFVPKDHFPSDRNEVQEIKSMFNRLLDVLSDGNQEVEPILTREDLDHIRNSRGRRR